MEVYYEKEFIEPEVEVVEFEVEENVAYIDSEGWIIDQISHGTNKI
ncbi:MAG: hypothetical protein ACLRPW_08370 [Intestinibacter sp.]